MRFRIWRERPGVVSPGPCWCCAYDGVPGYLHLHESLFRLLWQVITEFRHDRHLVG
jgi:hypothetical protein